MKLAIFPTLCVTLAFLGLGCQSDPPVDTSTVDDTTKLILQQIAEGEYEKPYNTFFAASFQNQIDLETWKKDAEIYHKRLGPLVDIQRDEVLSSTIRVGETIEGSFTYRATWKRGEGVVLVGMTRNGPWEVVKFAIDSPLFDASSLSSNQPLKPSTETAEPDTAPAEH